MNIKKVGSIPPFIRCYIPFFIFLDYLPILLGISLPVLAPHIVAIMALMLKDTELVVLHRRLVMDVQ